MKTLLLSIVLSLTVTMADRNSATVVIPEAGCPVFHNLHAIYLMLLVSVPDFQSERDLIGMAVDTTGLKASITSSPQSTENLQAFLGTKGIERINDPERCAELEQAAHTNGYAAEDPHQLVYYRFKDYFLVFHVTEDMMTKAPNTVIIMDDTYNVKRNFLIQAN